MLQYHQRSCYTCRYYRILNNPALNSECLNLGRTLSVGDILHYSDRARYCFLWKKRPNNWEIYVGNINPYINDKYIPEKTQKRLTGRKINK